MLWHKVPRLPPASAAPFWTDKVSSNPAENSYLLDIQCAICVHLCSKHIQVLDHLSLGLTGPDDVDEPTEQGMGQLLLVQSAASMRHLQESFQEDLAAVQHSCQHREHERTEAKQLLQEVLICNVCVWPTNDLRVTESD